MRRVEFVKRTTLTITGIKGFMERTVTPIGTGAKVGCPREFIGKKVYLVVLDD